VPNWPDLATGVAELRIFLNDGPTDRPVKRKNLVGNANAVNTIFETFEDRIVPGTLVASVDFTDVPSTLIDPLFGLVQLATPPNAGQGVRARYYFQFFLDSELQQVLPDGARETLDTEDVTQIPPGLKNVCLYFAGSFAFRKQAIRWATRMSNRFLLEEEPLVQEPIARPNHFENIATKFYDEARILRDDFYKRHSRSLAPAFNMFKAKVPFISPRR
jgi:hypothetical protein